MTHYSFSYLTRLGNSIILLPALLIFSSAAYPLANLLPTNHGLLASQDGHKISQIKVAIVDLTSTHIQGLI